MILTGCFVFSKIMCHLFFPMFSFFPFLFFCSHCFFGRRCKVSFLSVFAEIMTHHLFLFPHQFFLGMPSRSCVFLRRLMSKLIFRFCTVFLDFFFLFSVFDPFLMCALVNPLCVCVDLCLICSFDFLWFPLNFSLVFCFFPCF